MAQDYHIYIHSDINSNNGSDNPTQPFSVKKEKSFTQAATNKQVESVAETGASSLGKIGAVIAVATAIYKAADKVLTIGFSHLREYTGHYEYEMGLNNYKTAINHVTNPVGYFKQVIHRNFQYRLENQRIAEDSKLIGETIYSSQKIGV